MKRLFIVFAICISLCFCFVGCMPMPFKAVKVEAKQPRIYSVYVCGAVQTEGYVQVPEGSDYSILVESAGYIVQTCFPALPYTLVTENTLQLNVQWYFNGKPTSCLNVNGGYLLARQEVEGIDISVINKIADYLDMYGKITDKILLKEILGEDYEDNFYKFFVSIDDYEKIS